MNRLFALLLPLVAASGCFRMHQVTPDGLGGVYFVSQKHFLGVGGKQTLISCPAAYGEAATCYTVLEGPQVSELTAQPETSDLFGGLYPDDDYNYPGVDGYTSDELDGLYGPSGGVVTCPEGAFKGEILVAGTLVNLIAIHSDDAYAGGTYESDLPISGRVDEEMHANDGCWLGGSFTADSGANFYFYKAAFELQ